MGPEVTLLQIWVGYWAWTWTFSWCIFQVQGRAQQVQRQGAGGQQGDHDCAGCGGVCANEAGKVALQEQNTGLLESFTWAALAVGALATRTRCASLRALSAHCVHVFLGQPLSLKVGTSITTDNLPATQGQCCYCWCLTQCLLQPCLYMHSGSGQCLHQPAAEQAGPGV